ncbi:DUF4350 domain-containing protein [Acaricomes phytoseiuli]|nr:DUF4350 domain-containing protein [Acaricomes phytoseiuli]
MMVSDTTANSQHAPSGNSTQLSARHKTALWWQSRRGRIGIIVVFFVLSGLTLILTATSMGASRTPLAADNPAPEGGMALAEILGRQGVTVTSADTLDSALAAQDRASDAGDTASVMVYDQRQALDQDKIAQLRASGMPIIWVSPGPLTLSALNSSAVSSNPPGDGIQSAGVSQSTGKPASTTLSADCSLPEAQAAQSINTGESQLYTGATTCFRSAESGRSDAGILAQTADGQLTVLGSAALFSNDQLARSGNAALALRLLGKDQQLIWYLPGINDLPEAQRPQQLADFLPGWVTPVSLWLAGVALLAMLWRGRRDGPLVEEPLPVVVKASETALGRARLYQDARAASSAAANLRAATLQRLARRLRLGRGSTREDVLIAAQKKQSELSEAEFRGLLLEETPDDRHLAAWAKRLQRAEDEVISNLSYDATNPNDQTADHAPAEEKQQHDD